MLNAPFFWLVGCWLFGFGFLFGWFCFGGFIYLFICFESSGLDILGEEERKKV